LSIAGKVSTKIYESSEGKKMPDSFLKLNNEKGRIHGPRALL